MKKARTYRAALVLLVCSLAQGGCLTGALSEAPTTQPTTDPSVGTIGGLESADPNKMAEPPGGADGAEALLDQRITIGTPPGKSEYLGAEYLLDVIRVINESSFGGSLIVDTSLSGTFHAKVDGKPVREVLDAICEQAQCSWEITDTGALRIYDSEESH